MSAELVLKHLELLQRMGWWSDAERVLVEHGRPFFDEDEFTRRLQYIRDKKRIYSKLAPVREDGKSFIGDDDKVEMRKGRVVIRYHLKDSSLDIKEIFRSLLRVMDSVGARLSFSPLSVEVDLHGPASMIGESCSDGRGGREWAGGVYDGVIRIRSQGLYGCEPQRVYVLVAHEFTHQAVRSLSCGKCPRWLDEGLAIEFSQDISEEYAQVLESCVENGRVFPLEALEADALFDADRESSVQAYAQSFSMVSYLRGYIGWDGMARLVRLCGASKAGKALQEFGMNYYLLEKQWVNWVIGR